MRFLGRLLKFLFWVLLVSTVVKLLGRLVSASRTRRAPGGRAASAEPRKLLVKDPVCGMHMAEELALPLQADGDVRYFCSEGCRSKYEHSMVRRKVSA